MQPRGRLLETDPSALLHRATVPQVNHAHPATIEDVAQVAVVGQCLDQSMVVGNGDLGILHHDGHPGTVALDPEPSLVPLAGGPVTVPVLVEVATIVGTEQLDAAVSPVMPPAHHPPTLAIVGGRTSTSLDAFPDARPLIPAGH